MNIPRLSDCILCEWFFILYMFFAEHLFCRTFVFRSSASLVLNCFILYNYVILIFSLLMVTYVFFSISKASQKGFDGPRLGVKLANENKREFSEETIIKGKSQLSMQEDALSRGASQRGMTPYGMTRKM